MEMLSVSCTEYFQCCQIKWQTEEVVSLLQFPRLYRRTYWP